MITFLQIIIHNGNPYQQFATGWDFHIAARCVGLPVSAIKVFKGFNVVSSTSLVTTICTASGSTISQFQLDLLTIVTGYSEYSIG